MRPLRTTVGIFVLGLIVGGLAALRLLMVFDWDPTVFTAFGDDAVAITEYAEEKLGREVLTRPNQGHDGKFFFVQANDPWLLDPDNNAAILDRPEYRSRRMFYPVLAGGLGLFEANTIVWALPLVNVVMLAIGSWAVAKLSLRHGGPPWVGLAFALNLGLLSDLFIDSAGIVAFALAVLGVLWLEEDRIALAAASFSAAVLSREAMAIFLAFVVLGWLIRKRSIPWRASLPAAIALLGWEAYVRLGVDLPSVSNQDSALTFLPFSGLWGALTSGYANLLDYVAIGIFSALIVFVPYKALKSRMSLTWGAAGFAVLAPFLSFYIWQKSFDISRALAPLITVFVLEMFLPQPIAHETEQRTGVRPAT